MDVLSSLVPIMMRGTGESTKEKRRARTPFETHNYPHGQATLKILLTLRHKLLLI